MYMILKLYAFDDISHYGCYIQFKEFLRDRFYL